ncbi:hypothetical protein DPMN_054526 [Dreissena polymorpha]|uniref:Uncharacterized protein n=1 Tax=Dreissena polymorpha TaxID=45954 RepID=A0A9D4CN99_DREPO|nr:hypothetical protein DPMN_054526 [Dreissena polymorpha]
MNIARLPESVEYKILRQQQLMADPDSKTLTSNVRKILEKYNLPNPEELLEEVPTKDKWKQRAKMALVRSPERSRFIKSLPHVKLDLDYSGIWSVFVFVRFDLVTYILS